jgi:sec-independent protein translocase protein TatB
MFDIGWSEIAVIAVVALIVIGPKELPGVLRMVGQWMGKARKMAGEFQGQFQEAMREAEMADLKKSFDEVKEAATGFTGGNIMTSLQKDVTSALRIDDVDKPMDPQVAPSAEASATPAIEPATSSDAPATSATSSDARATSSDAPGTSSDAPGTPTTPEAPTPETFVEATTHAAVTEPVSEPLVITPEIHPEPAEPHAASEASDVLKGAKAS